MSDEVRCRSCGRSLAPAAQFCGGCGNPVLNSVDSPTMTVAAAGPSSAAPGDEWPDGEDPEEDWDEDDWDDRPRRRVWPFALLAVAVAIAVAAGLIVTRSDAKKHASVTSVTENNNGPIVMPSVVMFTTAQAVSELERAGVQRNRIAVNREPHDDVVPGTVLEQHPAAGISIARGVTLLVSIAPTTMPDFVGHSVNDASATLSTLNARFTIQNELDGTVADGTVTDQSPAPGAPFAPAVRLTVARKPIATKLGDLKAAGAKPAQSDFETIAGTQYLHSLTWNTTVCANSPPIDVTYNLAGRYRELLATAGLASETENPGAQVHFDIQVDGTNVLAGDLNAQTPVPIDIDLTKHQRLELVFTPNAASSPICSNARVALGRARLLSLGYG